MKLREVKISGFRSLWDVSVTDLRDVNVFFGDNNSGKSNLLDALAVLFKVEQRDLPVSGFYRSELSNFVDNFTLKPNGTKVPCIKMYCKIALGAEDIGNLPQMVDLLKKIGLFKERSQWLELKVEITSLQDGTANRVLKEAIINSVVLYDSSIPEPEVFFPSLVEKIAVDERENAVGQLIYYIINSFNKVNDRRFTEARSSTEIQDAIESLPQRQFNQWLRDLIESRGKKYEMFQKIQSWFNGEPFSYGKIRPIFAGERTDIIVEDLYGREFLVERLGTGVHQILVLLSEIAAKVSEAETKIFGIEELELNLSPHMQRETLKMLAGLVSNPVESGFSQLFLTSHSPYLCNRDLADIYAVSIEKERGTIIEHGENAVRKLIKHFDYDSFHLERRTK